MYVPYGLRTVYIHTVSTQWSVTIIFTHTNHLCLVFFTTCSYNSDFSDSYGEEGALWSFNYFFYNKKLKRIVFFTCQALRYIYIYMHVHQYILADSGIGWTKACLVCFLRAIYMYMPVHIEDFNTSILHTTNCYMYMYVIMPGVTYIVASLDPRLHFF